MYVLRINSLCIIYSEKYHHENFYDHRTRKLTIRNRKNVNQNESYYCAFTVALGNFSRMYTILILVWYKKNRDEQGRNLMLQ